MQYGHILKVLNDDKCQSNCHLHKTLLWHRMMVVVLRQVGTSDCSREKLKISGYTTVNWSMQGLRTWLGTPSGPVAFFRFILRKADLISAMVTVGIGTVHLRLSVQ